MLRVFRWLRGLACTIAVLSMAGPLRAADPTTTPIGLPGSVVTDSLGNLYFGSQTRVFKLDRSGVLTVVAGTGEAGYGGDGGPATQALLNFPMVYPELVQDPVDYDFLVGGLAVDGAGNLYIADAYNNRVRKIDRNGIIATVAGTGERGHSGDGGLAINARFWWPSGVAFDSTGNLFVTDSNGTLRKVSPDGVISGIAGFSCAAHSSTGLCLPAQIAADPGGNVYIANTGGCDVLRVSRDGTIALVAGGGPSCGFLGNVGGDGGPATAATLSGPFGVAVDGPVLYVADPSGHCVRKVDASGIISTVAGLCGSAGFAGDGGAAASARLNQPFGVAVDTAGNLFIADTGNCRIRKVTPGGMITTVAGNGVAAFSGQLSGTSTTVLGTSVRSDGSAVLNAAVTGSFPTGTVTFLDGSTVLGSASLNPSGLLTLVYVQLPLTGLTGAHTLTARYSGDPNNLPSQSAASVVNFAASSGGTASTPGSGTAPSGSSGGSGGGGAVGALDLCLLLWLGIAVRCLRSTRRRDRPASMRANDCGVGAPLPDS